MNKIGRVKKAIWLLMLLFLISSWNNCFAAVDFPPWPHPDSIAGVAELGSATKATVTAGSQGRDEKPTNPGASAPYKENLFSKEYFRLLVEDTKHVLTAPVRWEKKEWTIFSLATAGVATVALLDRSMWNFAQRNQSQTADSIADVAAKVGGGYSLALLVPFYLAGEMTGNIKAKSVALDGWACSMIAAGIISPALKLAAGRSAPKEDEGTYRFAPFSYRFSADSHESFPSGHAAQAFGIATVIASHYEQPWVGAAAYGIASLTSASRLYQGVHWISDSIAGALIGIAVGKSIVYFNEKRRRENREANYVILPLIAPGGFGMTITFRSEKF